MASNPRKHAKDIREKIGRRTGKKVGILIIDSGLAPLRIGTTGLALAVAVFRPSKDKKGEKKGFIEKSATPPKNVDNAPMYGPVIIPKSRAKSTRRRNFILN